MSGPITLPPQPVAAGFVRCHDGDTCTFNLVLEETVSNLPIPGVQAQRTSTLVVHNQVIRLCDIDSPELHGPDHAAALQARDHVVALLREAAAQGNLQVKLAGTTDKYGRWLAWVIADGVDVGTDLRKSGLARPYPQKCPQ